MMKINKIMLMLLTLTIVILLSSTSFATSNLKNEKEQKQEEIDKIKKEIEEAKKNKSNTLKDLQDLDAKLTDMQQKITTLETEVDEKEKEIEKTKKELKLAEDDEKIQYQRAKKRIKYMYENGDTGYIDVILQSKDLSEFLSRAEYIEKIVDYDKNILKQLEETKEAIKEKKVSLKKQKDVLDHKEAEMTLQISIQEEAKDLKNTQLENYINKLATEEDRLAEEKKALQNLDSQIKALEENSSENPYVGGDMQWPVPNYYRISSPFGPRIHPVFKTQSIHTGIDIPAPLGTTIVAAASGTVVEAGWNNAYGYQVMIDHGGGYITQYGHNSSMLVSKGQKVQKGQPVSRMGTTGFSTGSHLHFGVRKGGSWINPVPLLKK